MIIPPARKDRIIAGLVVLSMLASYLFTMIPALSGISSGMRVIILTVLISGAAAFYSRSRRIRTMQNNIYIYIAIMVIVTTLIRVIPLT